MSNEVREDFDSDEFVSEKFSKYQKPQRFNVGDRDRKDNWKRDKRRSKEKDRNKFFER
jgi:hypothetical protein